MENEEIYEISIENLPEGVDEEGWVNENGDFVSYVRGENDESYFEREGRWFVRKY